MLSESILTVLTPAATIDLTTLDRAKAELGVTNNASDSLITAWIHEVSSRISSACGRTFGLERLQETFDPAGPHHYEHYRQGRSEVLRLSRWPVSAIESVTVNGVLLDVSDYADETQTGLLYRVTDHWRGQVVVIYSAGYELVSDLPYDIEQACLLLLRYRQSASSRDPLLRSKAIQDVGTWTYFGGVTSTQTGSLPSDVDDILQSYKTPNLA